MAAGGRGRADFSHKQVWKHRARIWAEITPLAVVLSSIHVQFSCRLATVKKFQLCCAHNMPEQLSIPPQSCAV